MSTTHYCSVCGAANEQASTQCFACSHPLAQLAEEREESNNAPLHGRYHLGMILGSGGFSTVYRARDLQTGREVASKQVRLRGLNTEETIEATHTFHREVSLLSTLRHPQVPQLYDHFSDRDHWYLVLQYLEGITLETDLETRAAQGRAVQLDETLDLTLHLCAVLDYLHTQEPPVIFRDLKPSNIMCTPEGNVCLIDFGIARSFRPGQARDTQPLGSPGYAAPEQYGRAQTTPQTDIYSLGALLHALLTGHDPSERGLTLLHLEQEVGGIDLAACVQRMVAPSPSERPASIREVATVLEAIQRQRQSAARIWHPPVPQTPQISSQAASSKQPLQIQLPTQPGNAFSPPATHRVTRRNVLIGLGMLTAATVGSTIWWTNRRDPRPSSGVVGPSLPPNTYSGPVYVYRASWITGFVTAVAWSPESRRIASNSLNGEVQVWDASDGGHPFTYSAQTNVHAVAWSPDGKRIASTDGTVQVWDATSGEQLFSYQGQTSNVAAVAWSPDGKHIASTSNDGTVQVWDARTGERRLTYRGHAAPVSPPVGVMAWSIAWSPDSRRIASTYEIDPTVHVWDASTGQHYLTYRGHQSFGVNAVAWSPDGKYIVSGADDGTAQVWSTLDGRHMLTYGGERDGTYTGHGDVCAVAWSPDGKRIASGSSDGTAQVWNAP
jgi:serine/threonine protein kinase